MAAPAAGAPRPRLPASDAHGALLERPSERRPAFAQDDYNFLRALSRDQYNELRDTVIQLVLGTDMKFHFEHYTKFKTKCASDTFVPGCERADVKFLLSVAVHTADIANPAKPRKTCLRWTELVMEEFFRQGDLELEMGLPISPFYDRHKT